MIATYNGEPFYRFVYSLNKYFSNIIKQTFQCFFFFRNVIANDISQIDANYATPVIIQVDGHEIADDVTPQGINLRAAFKQYVEDVIRESFGPTVVQNFIKLNDFNDGEAEETAASTKQTDDVADMFLNLSSTSGDDSDDTVKATKTGKKLKRKAESASLSPPSHESKQQRTDA